MFQRFAFLVLMAVLAGCGHDPSIGTGAVSIGDLTNVDKEILISTGLKRPAGSILMTMDAGPKAQRPSPLNRIFSEHRFSGEQAYIRNPGLNAIILTRNGAGKTLTAADHKVLQGAATKIGAKIWPDLKLPPIFGPDGKTPKVLMNTTTFLPPGETRTIMTAMVFKTEEAARMAAASIGPGYTVKVEYVPHPKPKPKEETPSTGMDWQVTATFRGDENLATEEIGEFERLAKAFGGLSLSTGSS